MDGWKGGATREGAEVQWREDKVRLMSMILIQNAASSHNTSMPI